MIHAIYLTIIGLLSLLWALREWERRKHFEAIVRHSEQAREVVEHVRKGLCEIRTGFSFGGRASLPAPAKSTVGQQRSGAVRQTAQLSVEIFAGSSR